MVASKLQQYLAYYRRSASGAGGGDGRILSPLALDEYYDGAAIAATVNGNLPYYMNFGYWRPDTRSIEEASNELMRMIVGELRDHSRRPRPWVRILDVACGLGATTKYLWGECPSASIFGINITDRQLECCRRIAPQCDFRTMTATAIEFEDEYFDCVTCIEAAFQFRTRKRFIEEAFRVLAPGGVLALTDVLVRAEAHAVSHMFSSHHPPENQVATIEAYRDLVLDSGFSQCRLMDITEPGAKSFFRFQTANLNALWQQGRISFSALQRQLAEQWLHEAILEAQILCIAVK